VNYLAHALLAEPYAYSVIGNVAGDLVKGRLDDHSLHPRVVDGIRRHRRADALTDRHATYRNLVARFPEAHRRVAPIVLDVLFDHYLHRSWARVSPLDRDAFIDGVYGILVEPGAPLPAPLAALAPRWVAADWLRVSARIEGVAAILERLAQRARRPLPLLRALAEAEAHHEEFEAGFLEIFRRVRTDLDGLPEAFRSDAHSGACP
jgi:acyl carrier protein phosphodiesterase